MSQGFGSLGKLHWPLLLAIALGHILVFYLLLRALAPDFTAHVARKVVTAFDISAPPPLAPPPPPPPGPPEPDTGAQGDPAAGAPARPEPGPTPANVPDPITPLSETSSTETSSIGAADRSGAGETGEGTGAAGSGLGTGSGSDGAGQGNAASQPVHISGTIDSARDYPVPESGRNSRRGAEVIVKVTIGIDGRASQCQILRASAFPRSDQITCELVVERLRFEPARNAAGEAIPAPFYWRQRWF